MPTLKVIIFSREGIAAESLYGALKDKYDVQAVVLEQPTSKWQIVLKRGQRIGVLKIVGQILFMLLVVPFLRLFGKSRIMKILQSARVLPQTIDPGKIFQVNTANNQKVIELLKTINPQAVVVYGTRLLSKEILSVTGAVFFNIHAGITPLYRGSHGAYWALLNKDYTHCGVTVHQIDTGIDTGKIFAQGIIVPSKEDNFTTYPFLQLALGIKLLENCLQDLEKGKLEPKPAPQGFSKLWTHPTIWQYIKNRISLGVK